METEYPKEPKAQPEMETAHAHDIPSREEILQTARQEKMELMGALHEKRHRMSRVAGHLASDYELLDWLMQEKGVLDPSMPIGTEEEKTVEDVWQSLGQFIKAMSNEVKTIDKIEIIQKAKKEALRKYGIDLPD